MNLPIRIEIPKFVRQVKMSDSQRAIYFEWNGRFIKGKNKTLPISFYKNKFNIKVEPVIEDLKEGFVIGYFKDQKVKTTFRDTELLPKNFTEESKGKYILCSTIGNKFEPIILNHKKVGTPRYYLIKGQDIYSGNLREHQKGIIMDAIKQCYLPFVKDIPVIDNYPIKISCELHETIKNVYDKAKGLGSAWDVDNYVYPYMKAFPDLLQSLGKIRNDDRLHIPSCIAPVFVPIENHEDRKFVFIIETEDREAVTSNKTFQEYFADFNAGFKRDVITGETEDNQLSNLNFED